jgi:putative glutathione S-transferase
MDQIDSFGKKDVKGRFKRKPSSFRNHISRDDSSGFPAEENRYHLYISHACPWAHRTMIMRKLKGLEDAISYNVVDFRMDDQGGWHFTGDHGATKDTINGKESLQGIYLMANPDFHGVGTVPVLWDKKQETIVNNESREIIRMFDTEFDGIAKNEVSFLPNGMEEVVDDTIDSIYEPINNGVYRSGFAGTQEAYEEAVTELFNVLDQWDEILGKQRYLCGSRMTEADICMFTTLIRFDLVYHGHFKCNIRRIIDYHNLWNYVKDIYQTPGVSDTCNFYHMKHHYYWSHTSLNPKRIVPLGPEINYNEPHDRSNFS